MILFRKMLKGLGDRRHPCLALTVVLNQLLLCSHSPDDVPPEPQRNVSIAAVRGAVRPSNCSEPLSHAAIYLVCTYSFVVKLLSGANWICCVIGLPRGGS